MTCSRCRGPNESRFKTCDKCRVGQKRWRDQNPEKQALANRSWRERNPVAVKSARDSWRQRNPDYWKPRYAEMGRRRRALLKGASISSFAPSALEARLSMYPRCWICKIAEPTHVDHVEPLSKGGAHILANLRPACESCNKHKGATWPFDPQS
jgi:5-methylcytosine-specific restriction endonuclease McrA